MHMTQTEVSSQVLPRLVAFDLDDTLAPSKSAMPPAMAAALRRLLDVVPVCIISGGQVGQFHDQVLAHLDADADELSRLHLMPTCGTRYYTYDASQAGAGTESWTLVYANDLTPEQIRTGFEIVEAQARRLGLWEERTWGGDPGGPRQPDHLLRPGGRKPLWRPNAPGTPRGEKKATLRDAVAPLLPELEVRSGGSTSVDITLKGVDKAYGMKRLAEVTGIALEEMLFVGDRLDPEGNDYPVKALGVPCQAVGGWQDTVTYVTALASLIAAQERNGEDHGTRVSLAARL